MAFQDTNLVIKMGAFPPTWRGTPQDLANEIIRRSKIVSPNGTNFIFMGDVEPTSNVGPWLKDGNKWYTFDEDVKRYVPLDISDSDRDWFQVGVNAPSLSDPPVWLKTTKDATEADPSIGNPVGWYVHNGTGWVPFVSIVLSGPTSTRPTGPVEYQQYYDTDISVLIWWERSAWRTISGVPGDIKFVNFTVLTEALEHNPGWALFGENNQNLRGRYISQATKDSGSTPETDLTVAAGIAKRAAFETFGQTDGVKMDAGSAVPYPPTVALWLLVKE